MKRPPARTVSFPPEEERALEELAEDYRQLLAGRESGLKRRLPALRLPGQARRRLAAGALGLCLCLLCLCAVPAVLSPGRARPAEAVLPAAALDAPPDRLALPPAEDTEGNGGRIAVNTAGADELALLPGIGPALAERIVAEREENGAFRLPEDLLAVRGIGPKKLKDILPLITLEEPAGEQ